MDNSLLLISLFFPLRVIKPSKQQERSKISDGQSEMILIIELYILERFELLSEFSTIDNRLQ